MNSQGTPYDYGSIMHYGERFFTRNGKPTIVPKKAGVSRQQYLSTRVFFLIGFSAYMPNCYVIQVRTRECMIFHSFFCATARVSSKSIQHNKVEGSSTVLFQNIATKQNSSICLAFTPSEATYNVFYTTTLLYLTRKVLSTFSYQQLRIYRPCWA